MDMQERIREAMEIILKKLGRGRNHEKFLEKMKFYSAEETDYCTIYDLSEKEFEIRLHSNKDINITQDITNMHSLEFYAAWLENIAEQLPQIAKTPEQIKSEKIAALKKVLEKLEAE